MVIFKMKLLVAVFLSFLNIQSAHADIKNETSLWFMSLTRVSIGEDYEAFIDLQPRTSLNATDNREDGQVQQFLARGAFGYRITDTTTLFQGYGVFTSYDPVRTEHRLFQEVLSRFSFEPFRYSHRFRFEQRFIDAIEEVGMRARSSSRFTIPLNYFDDVSLAFNEELFINLNNAGPGPQAGFDQNRLFFGINYQVSPKLSFDIGYQNQYVGRRGGREDISNHIFLIGAITAFEL
jgi:hypothetical protein